MSKTKEILSTLALTCLFMFFIFGAVIITSISEKEVHLQSQIDRYLLENPGESTYAYSGNDFLFSMLVKVDTDQVSNISSSK